MNRNRMIIGVSIALVVAFLASVYVFRAVQRVSVSAPRPTVRIVVAAEPLQVGTPLDIHNTRTIAWPADEPLEGSFHRTADCLGRAVITPIAVNEPILEPNLAPRAAGAGLPAAIPQGMRAVSVAVNDVVGVAGFVTPGTMVDVLVTGKLPGKSEGAITRTVLENVRVMAAGQQIEQDRDGKPEKVPVVTLLVSPEDADVLTMASTEGKIQLALRNTVDTASAEPAAVLQASLFAGPAAPAPVHAVHEHAKPAPPPPPYTVEVINGTKKEEKSFAN
jgi:pilus assembly protein CpaB